MANTNTAIEWTDAVWNPVTGCSKIELHPERLDWPLRWRGSKQANAECRPSRIFVNSMSDLFHESVPDEFIDRVFAVMALAKQYTFQVLTKRPERMLSWAKEAFTESGGLRIAGVAASLFRGLNLRDRKLSLAEQAEVSNQFEWKKLNHVQWGGSVEDQTTADERIPLLLQTSAAVRFVSYEPALGPVDFSRWLDPAHGSQWADTCSLAPCDVPHLDWIIAGSESGPKARPSHPDWFRQVRDQCQKAGVPFFMKQITERGHKVPLEQWPQDLKVREFPNA